MALILSDLDLDLDLALPGKKSFGVDVAGRRGMDSEEYREKLREVLARRERVASVSSASASTPGLNEAYALVAKELRLARSDGAGAGGIRRRSPAAAAASAAATAVATGTAGLGHRFSTSSSRPGSSSAASGAAATFAGGARLDSPPVLPADVSVFSQGVGGGVSGSGNGSASVSAVPFLTGGGRYSRWQAPLGGGRRPSGHTAGWNGWEDGGVSSVGGGGGSVLKKGSGVDSKVRHATLHCCCLFVLGMVLLCPGVDKTQESRASEATATNRLQGWRWQKPWPGGTAGQFIPTALVSLNREQAGFRENTVSHSIKFSRLLPLRAGAPRNCQKNSGDQFGSRQTPAIREVKMDGGGGGVGDDGKGMTLDFLFRPALAACYLPLWWLSCKNDFEGVKVSTLTCVAFVG